MTESAVFSTFARADVAFERGEGVWLWDEKIGRAHV